MLASSQLHRETSPGRFRINSMLERFQSPLEKTLPWLTEEKTWSRTVRDDDDDDEDDDVDDQRPPETVFVNLDVDSEETSDTKYVQLRIRTK